MSKRIALSFAKNLYFFFILLLSDPFDILERYFDVNYKPPPWLFWVLLAVASGLAVWRTVEGTRKSISDEEKLDSIKDSLIAIGNYQREAAINQSGLMPSNTVKARITQDALTLYPISQVESLIQTGIKTNNADPLISFYKKFGDILDANNCGLKVQLQNTPAYNKALDDLTSKSVTLRFRTKKRELIQNNVNRVLDGGYGLNSGIILRSMLKTSHPRNKTEGDAMHILIVGLENLENIGRAFLTYGLGHLDTKWKPNFSAEQLKSPEMQVMLDRVSKLNKKSFRVLHDFKNMITRQGQGKG